MIGQHGQCEALTKNGRQCSFNSRWTIPNHANRDLKPVLLCGKHKRMYERHKFLELIKGCFLQPGNKYGYGTVVTSEKIDYENMKKSYSVTKYWRKRPSVAESQN